MAGGTGRRGETRRRRKRDREVVDAAVKVFHQRGYSAATVQDVADALGILKGSLYHYIDTKEDLLFRVFEDVHGEVDQILEKVGALDASPVERLTAYVRLQIAYNMRNPQRISIYYDDMGKLSPERANVVLEHRRASARFVTDLIEEGQRDGSINADRDARVMSNCVFAVVVWTYRWYSPRRGIAADTVAEQCTAFAINGLVGVLTGGDPLELDSSSVA